MAIHIIECSYTVEGDPRVYSCDEGSYGTVLTGQIVDLNNTIETAGDVSDIISGLADFGKYILGPKGDGALEMVNATGDFIGHSGEAGKVWFSDDGWKTVVGIGGSIVAVSAVAFLLPEVALATGLLGLVESAVYAYTLFEAGKGGEFIAQAVYDQLGKEPTTLTDDQRMQLALMLTGGAMPWNYDTNTTNTIPFDQSSLTTISSTMLSFGDNNQILTTNSSTTGGTNFFGDDGTLLGNIKSFDPDIDLVTQLQLNSTSALLEAFQGSITQSTLEVAGVATSAWAYNDSLFVGYTFYTQDDIYGGLWNTEGRWDYAKGDFVTWSNNGGFSVNYGFNDNYKPNHLAA